MQLPMLLTLLSLAAQAQAAGPAPSDIEARRFEIVVPPNDFFYQSFSKSQPAYSIVIVLFSFPENRLIVHYDWSLISGTGLIRETGGGRGTNYLIIRVESGDSTFNYRVDFNSIPVETTTTSTTPTTTTTESEPTSTETEPTSTETEPTTTETEPTSTETEPTTTETEPTSTETEPTTTETEPTSTETEPTTTETEPTTTETLPTSTETEPTTTEAPTLSTLTGSTDFTEYLPSTTCTCECG